MAPSSSTSTTLSSQYSLKVAVVTVIIMFSISLLPCSSVYCASNSEVGLREREKVLGSRPPGCVNKCFNCKPCMATLVMPSQQHGFKGFTDFRSSASSLTRQEDDTYYLLTWKCRCGDKYFQP